MDGTHFVVTAAACRQTVVESMFIAWKLVKTVNHLLVSFLLSQGTDTGVFGGSAASGSLI